MMLWMMVFLLFLSSCGTPTKKRVATPQPQITVKAMALNGVAKGEGRPLELSSSSELEYELTFDNLKQISVDLWLGLGCNVSQEDYGTNWQMINDHPRKLTRTELDLSRSEGIFYFSLAPLSRFLQETECFFALSDQEQNPPRLIVRSQAISIFSRRDGFD